MMCLHTHLLASEFLFCTLGRVALQEFEPGPKFPKTCNRERKCQKLKKSWGRIYVTNLKINRSSGSQLSRVFYSKHELKSGLLRRYCGVASLNHEHTEAANVCFVYPLSEVDKWIQGSLKHRLS